MRRIPESRLFGSGSVHIKLTYLDLVSPVPDGTLGDEISPSVSTVDSSLCTMPSYVHSVNDVRHVFCGRPLVLPPDSGIQVMV